MPKSLDSVAAEVLKWLCFRLLFEPDQHGVSFGGEFGDGGGGGFVGGVVTGLGGADGGDEGGGVGGGVDGAVGAEVADVEQQAAGDGIAFDAAAWHQVGADDEEVWVVLVSSYAGIRAVVVAGPRRRPSAPR